MLNEQDDYIICFTFHVEHSAYSSYTDKLYFRSFPSKENLLKALGKEWIGQIPSDWAAKTYNTMTECVENLHYSELEEQFAFMTKESYIDKEYSNCKMAIEYVFVY